MNALKGFINVGAWEDNVPGATAEFGELSPIAYSYSREIGKYTRPSSTLRLMTFLCVDSNHTKVSLPNVIANAVLDVADRVVMLYDNGEMVDFENEDQFLTYLRNYFAAPVYQDFQLGELIPSTSGNNQQLPDFLAWSHNQDGYEFEIRIWFSDAAFRAQYDEYEITVIPPLKEVDDLNGTPMAVNSRLNAVTKTQLTEWIDEAKGDSNVTVIRSYPLTWHDPFGNEVTIETPWTILVNGIAGNNAEAINEAIIDYLTANSTVDLERWKIIYPYLFAKTEFYLMPMWHKVAIPEASDIVGVYSGFLNPLEIPNRFPNYTPGYTPEHVQSNYTVMAAQYKSIMVASIGNILNHEGKIYLEDLYPDFINVATTSSDFARMHPDTQEFALFINTLLELAERVGPTTILNTPFSRVVREGKVYVTGRVGEANITCISKHSYEG